MMSFGTLAEIVLLTSASAMAATGVSGSVTISPAHPGPQRIGESGRAPMKDASIRVLDAHRRVVAHAVTGADGRFCVTVPPGDYSVEVDVGTAVLPRCDSVRASVRSGHVAEVQVACDSGMR